MCKPLSYQPGPSAVSCKDSLRAYFPEELLIYLANCMTQKADDENLWESYKLKRVILSPQIVWRWILIQIALSIVSFQTYRGNFFLSLTIVTHLDVWRKDDFSFCGLLGNSFVSSLLPFHLFQLMNRSFSFDELVFEKFVNTILKFNYFLDQIICIDENNVILLN